jgi:plasmid stabilization system protein ParE
MGKRLIWSVRAQNDRKSIFAYWNNRNGSRAYSSKLNRLLLDALSKVCEFSEAGQLADEIAFRSIIVRDYRIYYDVGPDFILVLTIWDTRQNPDELSGRLK